MKKIISSVLSVIMLLSVFAFEGSAAFNLGSKAPVVASVECLDKIPVIKSEVKRYQNEIGVADGIAYDLYYSDAIYKFKVTFEDGKESVFTTADYSAIDDTYVLLWEATVSKENYDKAIKNKKKSVEIDFSCSVEKLETDFIDTLFPKESEKKNFTFTKKLSDEYVKSIKYVSGLPKKICKNADYVDLKGVKFSVKYASGKTKTYTCKEYKNEKSDYYFDNITGYTINGQYINFGFTSKGIKFTYLDAPAYTKKMSFKENPYKSIKITDYVFDNSKGFQSVSYKVTKKNGTSKDYSYDLSRYFEDYGNEPSVTINKFDGYYVCVNDFDVRDKLYKKGIIGTDTDTENTVCLALSIGEGNIKIYDYVKFEAEPANTAPSLSDIDLTNLDINAIIELVKTAIDYITSLLGISL